MRVLGFSAIVLGRVLQVLVYVAGEIYGVIGAGIDKFRSKTN